MPTPGSAGGGEGQEWEILPSWRLHHEYSRWSGSIELDHLVAETPASPARQPSM
jgi:hypothetical protein